MNLICPLPIPWEEAYQRLAQFARENHLDPPQRPLILSLWHLTDDLEKQNRWQYHLRWASDNGCEELLSYLPESDFYTVQELYISPHLPQLFAQDNYKKKLRPTDQELDNYLKILEDNWKNIVGDELSKLIIKPIGFSGPKARLLWVLADGETKPPWGPWGEFDSVGEIIRYEFTKFRFAVCKAISPHQVDHICFRDQFGKFLD